MCRLVASFYLVLACAAILVRSQVQLNQTEIDIVKAKVSSCLSSCIFQSLQSPVFCIQDCSRKIKQQIQQEFGPNAWVGRGFNQKVSEEIMQWQASQQKNSQQTTNQVQQLYSLQSQIQSLFELKREIPSNFNEQPEKQLTQNIQEALETQQTTLNERVENAIANKYVNILASLEDPQNKEVQDQQLNQNIQETPTIPELLQEQQVDIKPIPIISKLPGNSTLNEQPIHIDYPQAEKDIDKTIPQDLVSQQTQAAQKIDQEIIAENLEVIEKVENTRILTLQESPQTSNQPETDLSLSSQKEVNLNQENKYEIKEIGVVSQNLKNYMQGHQNQKKEMSSQIVSTNLQSMQAQNQANHQIEYLLEKNRKQREESSSNQNENQVFTKASEALASSLMFQAKPEENKIVNNSKPRHFQLILE